MYFPTKLRSVYVFGFSVCSSVRSLTLVNILHMTWNWYMLFVSDAEGTALKMVCIRLMVSFQRHTKVFRYITNWEKCLKLILTYLDCTKYNEINISHSHKQKHVSYKNNTKSTNILLTGLHKNFPIHCILWGKFFKAYFNIFIYIFFKDNEINIRHSDTQYHTSCKKWYK